MKEFIKQIPSKIKAIYVLWVFINIILFAFGYGNRPYSGRGQHWDLRHFFPFDTGVFYYNVLSPRALGTYDYTEFLIYVLTPVVLAYAIWLFVRKPNKT